MQRIGQTLCLIAGFLFCLFVLPGETAAAGVTVQTACLVQAEDFSCKGVSLGDSAAHMKQVFGEALFDKEQTVQGIRVKYYTFAKGFVFGVAVRTDRVIDIKISNQQYEGRNGVHYGATPYKITETYGRTNRTFLDGVKYYIYANPQQKQQRLLLEADTADGSLLSWRMTSLPLTDTEAANWTTDEDWDSTDINAITMGQRDIDTRALPQDKTEVRLEMKG